MVILLKGRILPIGGASGWEGLRLQPAQQALLYSKDIFEGPSYIFIFWPTPTILQKGGGDGQMLTMNEKGGEDVVQFCTFKKNIVLPQFRKILGLYDQLHKDSLGKTD